MFKYLLAAVMMLTVSSAYADNLTREEINCLRLNTYHEARGEDYEGQVAVVQVVLNRINSDRYPDNACDVIYQGRHDQNGNPIRYKCQFSWYCDGRSDRIRDRDAYDVVSLAVQEAIYLYNNGFDITDGSMYYHTDYVEPFWAKHMTRIDQIGVHIFYTRG